MKMQKKILLLFLIILLCCSLQIIQIKDNIILRSTLYTEIDFHNPKLKTVNRLLYYDSLLFSGKIIQKDSSILKFSQYKNGLLNGKVISYYNNGHIKEERYFENGLKQGEHKGWWDDGKIRFIYHFKNDLFEGNVKQWNSSGMLFSDFNYDKGQEEGLQRAWFPNGDVQANYIAKNNRKYGITGVKYCKSIF